MEQQILRGSLFRLDILDGLKQAYLKLQSPGNYVKGIMDSNYQMTCYVPIEGEMEGLLYRGELQEIIYREGYAALRQLSMAIQNEKNQCAIGGDCAKQD